MVKSKSKTVENYRAGIENFGVDNYTTCGRKADTGGFLDVAECLENAKEEALSVSSMVSRYEDAA